MIFTHGFGMTFVQSALGSSSSDPDIIGRLAVEHSGDTPAFCRAIVANWADVRLAFGARGWSVANVAKFKADCEDGGGVFA